MSFVLAAVAVAHLAGASQAGPPAPAAAQSAATARISGVVKNAADDAPLARARVTATSPALPEPRVVLSGSDGRYAIGDLPAGTYTIAATRTGFAAYTYGQGRTIAGTSIDVTRGQQVANVDLPLAAGGVIVGRILDEDGSPFAGAAVAALINRSQNGTDSLVSIGTAVTDDRGEFRLFGLPPGAYYVSAADPAFTNVSTPKGVQRFSATYYPGTTLPDQARTVTVSGASAPPRVEFRLQFVAPARVAGQLVAFDMKPLLGGTITMSPVEGAGVRLAVPESPQILPDGRFSFSGVSPGRYQIRARGETDPKQPTLFAVFSVEVSGADVDGIRMSLRPGAMLDGTVTVDNGRGTRAPDLTKLRVRAPFVDGATFGDGLTGTVQPTGAYALRGIMRGTHQILVDGLEAPWVLKSVSYRGKDITDVQLAVDEREQLHDVQIVITDVASEVSGLVQNARKLPAAGAGVLVCSSVPAMWMRTSRRMRVTYTDQQGRWTVAGLPPGEYFAVASPMIDESDLGRRDRIEALRAVGTPFRVDADDARPSLTLQVSPVVPTSVR